METEIVRETINKKVRGSKEKVEVKLYREKVVRKSTIRL